MAALRSVPVIVLALIVVMVDFGHAEEEVCLAGETCKDTMGDVVSHLQTKAGSRGPLSELMKGIANAGQSLTGEAGEAVWKQKPGGKKSS